MKFNLGLRVLGYEVGLMMLLGDCVQGSLGILVSVYVGRPVGGGGGWGLQ